MTESQIEQLVAILKQTNLIIWYRHHDGRFSQINYIGAEFDMELPGRFKETSQQYVDLYNVSPEDILVTSGSIANLNDDDCEESQEMDEIAKALYNRFQNIAGKSHDDRISLLRDIEAYLGLVPDAPVALSHAVDFLNGN